MNVSIVHVFYWLGWFSAYVVSIIATGAVLGCILFLTIGALTHPEIVWSERTLNGLLDGARYAGLWAGGLAIVLCFMKGHRRSVMRQQPVNLDN